MLLYYAVIFWAHGIGLTRACLPPPAAPPTSPGAQPRQILGPDGNPIYDYSTILGGTARIDGMIPTGSGGPVISRASDLSCTDFDTSCRWRNERGYNEHPEVDEFEFVRGSGSPDPSRGALIGFGIAPSPMPSGKWAVAGSDKTAPRDHSALLVSDVIPCQQNDGEVKFNYWTTIRSRIRVCVRRPNSGKQYLYCSPEISKGDPGPAVVTIPRQFDPFELVFEVSGFDYNAGSQGGGGVVLDNIAYNGIVSNCQAQQFGQQPNTPYPWTRVPPTPAANWQNWAPQSWTPVVPPGGFRPGPSSGLGTVARGRTADLQACKAIKCSFRLGDPCAASATRSGWEILQGPSKNPHTGVRRAYRLGDPYALASGPAPFKSFKTGPFTLTQPSSVKFCYYRATVQATLGVTAHYRNSVPESLYNSPELSFGQNAAPPHQWICEQRPLQAGSYDALEFIAQNLRNQFAYLAVDEIELIDQTGPLC